MSFHIRSLILIVLLSSTAYSSDLISDPSAVPPPKLDSARYDERDRILADFNMDGLVDLALSSSLDEAGQSIYVIYTIYIKDSSGLYRKCGQIGSICGRLAVERTKGQIRIWSSGHLGQSNYWIGWNILSDTGFVSGESMHIDCGPEATIGGAVYESIWSNSSVPIVVEHSKTVDGVVTWLPGRF
jgi:hypothetical protein